MKATILANKNASSILFNGKFYDTKKEIDLSFSEAYRITRLAEVNADFGKVSYDPNVWAKEHFINFFGDIDGVSGFGGVSQSLIRYTESRIKTALVGRVYNVREQAIFAAQNRELRQSGAMIWHDQPRDNWSSSPFARNIAIVPFETTRVPHSWIDRLNHFDALFVPCKQNIQMFRDSGVIIPIELIHWGVDNTRFYPLNRPQRDVFTFGHMGALSIRKGTDLLVQAFTEAFPKEKDVQLICKTSYPNYPFMTKDKRIKVQMTPVTHEELMKDFFQKIDCFVFPTRGEGFGLTPLEAMATGVPSIVTGWSGPMEYMNPEVGWTLDYSFSPAKNFSEHVYKEDCGDWAEPNKEDLIEKMRYAYKNREETKKKGNAAAQYVKEVWLWNDKIKLYETALQKHL